MEDWQIEYINKNLFTLAKATKCTTSLKNFLLGNGQISDEEHQKLTRLGRNESEIQEATELYDILKKRTYGYDELIEVLDIEKQSGPRDILQDGYRTRVVTELEINTVLDLSIEITSRTGALREILPKFSHDDAIEVFRTPKLNREIRSIVHENRINHTIWKLDGRLPSPRDLYLPRSISNRLLIDPKVFKMKCRDVFVFKGVDRKELIQLVKPHVTRSSTTQQSIVTCRHIFLDDDEDWEDLLDEVESPMHLVCREGDDYVLQLSTEVTDLLRNNSLNNQRHQEAYITEEQFGERMLSGLFSTEVKGALLCDIPGMGKTLLMESLARKLGESAKKAVVFFIQLSVFSKHLAKQEGIFKKADTLSFILKFVRDSQLAIHLITQHSEKSGLQVLLLMDGFDEIRYECIDKTTSFLKTLNENKNVHLIISSRPQLRSHLEHTFKLASYNILPLSLEDQINILVQQWVLKCSTKVTGLEDLGVFARSCIRSIKEIQNTDGIDILGVPLKCYILALINERRALRIAAPGTRKRLNVAEAAVFKSIFEMYERFLEISLAKSEETSQFEQSSEIMQDKMFYFHTYLSLELLFPDIADEYYRYHQLESLSSIKPSVVSKMGVVSHRGQYEFFHRSFAEFFAGKFFANFWRKVHPYESTLVQKAGSLFLESVLRTARKQFEEALYQIDSFAVRYKVGFRTQVRNKKICEFDNGAVAWFTDNVPNTDENSEDDQVARVNEFKAILLSMNLIGTTKESLKKHFFFVLMSCIDAKFRSVMSLLTYLVRALFEFKELKELIVAPGAELDGISDEYLKLASAPLILYRLSLTGSPEIADAVFQMFNSSETNHLRFSMKFFSDIFASPLEVAIQQNDWDMALYFYDKMSVSGQQLLGACVQESEINAIMSQNTTIVLKRVTDCENSKILNLLLDKILANKRDQFKSLSIIEFAIKHYIRLDHLQKSHKFEIFKTLYVRPWDERLIKLLLILFAKNDLDTVTVHKGNGDEFEFTSEDVLDSLELSEVREAFSGLKLYAKYCFSDIVRFETVKILSAIYPDFSLINDKQRNYLHFALGKGKTDWVDHLVRHGISLKQKDLDGNTPLLCISPENCLDITRTLIEHEANVYAINNNEENIAHILFKQCTVDKLDNICEWVCFMLDNRYRHLWNMKNKQGETPFQALFFTITRKNNVENCNLKQLLFVFNRGFHLNADLLGSVRDINLTTVSRLVFQEKVSLRDLDYKLKRKFVSNAVSEYADDDFVTLLLLLFPNHDSTGLIDFGIESLLQCLNLPDIRETLSNLTLEVPCAFKNICRVATLQVLIGVWPDISLMTGTKWNYLHYAAFHGRVDWLVTLIAMGHDVGQRDQNGNPPLLSISPNNLVKVTQCLLMSKATVTTVNQMQENVAHRLFSQCVGNELEGAYEWTGYMMENGHKQLWNMRDREGKTPFEILSWDMVPILFAKNNPKQLLFSFNLDFHMNIIKYSKSFTLDLDYLKDLVFVDKISLANLKFDLKHRIISNTLEKNGDDELKALLLLLFPKFEGNDCVEMRQSNDVDNQRSHEVNNKILLSLDLPKAREVMTRKFAFIHSYGFSHIYELDTLKLLIEICPDFSKCNVDKRNYLHYAVEQGRIDWVEFLIQSGYNVNERNDYEETPLLCLSLNNPIEITRLLLDNNADPFAVDFEKQSVAHKFLEQCKANNVSLISDWVNYMLQRGYMQLWNLTGKRRSPSRTPLEILHELLGAHHPTTKSMIAQLSI